MKRLKWDHTEDGFELEIAPDIFLIVRKDEITGQWLGMLFNTDDEDDSPFIFKRLRSKTIEAAQREAITQVRSELEKLVHALAKVRAA